MVDHEGLEAYLVEQLGPGWVLAGSEVSERLPTDHPVIRVSVLTPTQHYTYWGPDGIAHEGSTRSTVTAEGPTHQDALQRIIDLTRRSIGE